MTLLKSTLLGGTPDSPDVEILPNHTEISDVSDKSLTTGNEDGLTHINRKVGDSKLRDQRVGISKMVAKKSNRKEDLSKKSLSFFPSTGDSGESSMAEDDDESGHNNGTVRDSPGSQDTTQPKKVHTHAKKDHKVAVPIESDHDDASSTSSCSCEDHSSVAGHSDDDPHGDLDYDDDSITNSPIIRHGRKNQDVETPEPSCSSSKLRDTGPAQASNGQTTNNCELIEILDQSDCEETRDTEPATKIRSFINHDCSDEKNIDPNNKEDKDRSHKSYGGLLKSFFKDACFFQIKSVNHENVGISKSMGVWSTPMQNEIRFNKAFREHRNVILIFSVQQSGAFQGFARMISESRPAVKPVPWVLPQRLSNASLGGVFHIQWLCTKELDFSETRDLYNSFNNNKPIKVARDGQQVEPKVARKLISLFPRDSKKRLLACRDKLKLQTRQRKEQDRSSFYPMTGARPSDTMPPLGHFEPTQHTGVINGYPSTSHHNQLYPFSADYNGSRIPPMGRRRWDTNPMFQGGRNNRRRPYPSPGVPPFRDIPSQYIQPYEHQVSNFNPTHPYHDDSYNTRHGTYHHQYIGPVSPGMQQQYPRAYQDWYSPNSGNQARYHPYQRARR